MGDGDPGAAGLAGTRLAAQLPRRLDQQEHPVHARMGIGETAAVGVGRKRSARSELAVLDTKMTAAADKASKGKYADAKQLLTQVDKTIAAVKTLADKAATVKKHYKEWGEDSLASLKSHPQKAEIADDIKTIEAKLAKANEKLTAKKFDKADELIKQVYWDCDRVKKRLATECQKYSTRWLSPVKRLPNTTSASPSMIGCSR